MACPYEWAAAAPHQLLPRSAATIAPKVIKRKLVELLKHVSGCELVVMLALALMLLFGKNLGDLARGLGAGREEFNKVWRQALE